MAIAVSLIVMYDAAGVRRAAGKQARHLISLYSIMIILILMKLKNYWTFSL